MKSTLPAQTDFVRGRMVARLSAFVRMLRGALTGTARPRRWGAPDRAATAGATEKKIRQELPARARRWNWGFFRRRQPHEVLRQRCSKRVFFEMP